MQMEKSSGLVIASLVAALVAGPDDVPEFASSVADWESFRRDESGARQSDNLVKTSTRQGTACDVATLFRQQEHGAGPNRPHSFGPVAPGV